ncbi:fidgetin-like protein 1 [Lineus longissimus]|uniref:fidgetin-like protein 1 n=1 Tax=Lineus longissimus TaxID=88925 RepID=UPI002B4F23D9
MTAEANSNESVHRWQQLFFQCNSEECTLPEKADGLRNLLSEVQYHRNSQSCSPACSDALLNSYANKYMAIVDCPDEKIGLNNYADGALNLARSNRNESSLWQTSLTESTLSSLESVQKLIEESKNFSEAILPSCDADIIISGDKDETANLKKSFQRDSSNKSIQRNESPSFANQGPDTSQRNVFNPRQKQTVPSAFGVHIGQSFGHQSSSPDQSLFSGAGISNLAKPPQRRQAAGPNFTFSKAVENKLPFPVAPSGSNHGSRGDLGPGAPEDEADGQAYNAFRTAKEQLVIDNQRRNRRGGSSAGSKHGGPSYGTSKKSLGTRRGPAGKFVPPVINKEDEDDGVSLMRKIGPGGTAKGSSAASEELDERYKHLDQKMVELIMSEIMDHGPALTWDDIAGLEFAKATIKEIVVWPMLRPDIFTGLRGPPKGLLLFGPPGTGKTLIGKCIASQSKSTFFSISASSLTSKWVGEGEKMVRTLFGVARLHQPAVIFIDEIDSLLSQRSDGEHESSRRIKTEFLVQLDGATTEGDERLLVVGATNRPQEIDEAARRRFVKRLYIQLPEFAARRQIIYNLLSKQAYELTEEEVSQICTKTEGYSGADMANLCREAALGPIRSISFGDIEHITPDQVRPIVIKDLEDALGQVRASVSNKDLDLYIEWNSLYGSGRR